jgi:hypothetical protein
MIIIKKHYGFGDAIHTITKVTGIEKVVKAVAGEDCGCKERKEMLNNPNLLINKIFYGTEQDIQVLRSKPESSGEEEGVSEGTQQE